MANEAEPLPVFKRGQVLLADDLNRLAAGIPQRTIGLGGTKVKSSARGLVIESDRNNRQSPGDTLIAEISTPVGDEDPVLEDHEVVWTKLDDDGYVGAGPSLGRAFEMNSRTRHSIPPGMRVLLRRAAGLWYFDAAAKDVACKITAEGDDTLTVHMVLPGGTTVDPAFEPFTIWKPRDLQKQIYNGVTENGYTYTYVSAQARTSTDGTPESQIVLPPYFVGALIFVYLPFYEFPNTPEGVVRCVDANRSPARNWGQESTG